MNLLDFATTPLWLVWDTVRDLAAEDGVDLAESELIGLAPLAAFLAVADRAGAPSEDADRAPARRPPPPTCDCATSRRCRPSSSGSRPPGPRGDRVGDRRPVPAHPRRPERRADARPPDRRCLRGRDPRRRRPDGGASQGDVGRLSAADVGGTDAPDAPVVACWEGRIAAVGPRAAIEAALEAEGYPLGRFARIDAAGGCVTPGLVDPHTHLLFAGSREGEWQLRQRGAGYLEILEAGGGILSTVAATRAASVDELLAHGRRWLDEMLGHGVTTIEAKSGYGLDLETEIRLIEAA